MLVIFDLDGTLFRTDKVVIPAVNDALSEVGLKAVDDEIIISLLGEKTGEFCRKLAISANDDQLNHFIKRLGHYEAKYIGLYGKLYEGVDEILDKLCRKGHLLSLCSNGSTEYVDFVLDSMHIKDYFKKVSSGKEHWSKGRMIKEILKEFDANEAVMVGDTQHDVIGAKDNRIPCIGVEYGYGDVDGAEYTIKTPAEIISCLDIFI